MRLLRSLLFVVAMSTTCNAEDLATGTTLHLDACERHRLQMAEMTRGAGANSSNIPEFVFFIEVTAFIDAYNSYTGIYQNRDDALRYVLDECAKDPTRTIGEILSKRFRIEKALNAIDPRWGEGAPEREAD